MRRWSAAACIAGLVVLVMVGCGDDDQTLPGQDASSAVDAGSQAVDMYRDVGSDFGGQSTDTGTDVSSQPDLGMPVTCEVAGRPGVCIDVSECDGDRVPTPGFCPGDVNIQCCTAVAAGTCDPDARPQPNVGLTEAPGLGGCPDGMAAVADFCIDVYEAALVDAATGEPLSPYFNPGATSARAVSISGAVPQGYISGDQAAAACSAAGKRLCTDTEWLRVCQSSAGLTYPYGDTRQPGVCNDARDQHPAVEYFMTTDNSIYSMLGHQCLNQLEDGLAQTGENAGCVTADGIFDMMGNLHEWTADPTGTFRGGFYVDTVINGAGCLYRTTAHNTQHWDYSTGFRCCADL